MFICTGNICRSAMAEGMLKKMAKDENLDIEVYYGGSITKENAKNVFDVSDGILLGKSSINIDELKSIINELN